MRNGWFELQQGMVNPRDAGEISYRLFSECDSAEEADREAKRVGLTLYRIVEARVVKRAGLPKEFRQKARSIRSRVRDLGDPAYTPAEPRRDAGLVLGQCPDCWGINKHSRTCPTHPNLADDGCD